MRADQLVKLANGESRTYPNVAQLRYAYERTHNHFHALRFDRYSLRDARTGVRIRPDKSGFCLGDRQKVSRPRFRSAAYYGPLTGECGRSRPQAVRVIEGLIPGYLDDYGPQLEGQYIDISGVPTGRYSLVRQVNADRRNPRAELQERRRIGAHPDRVAQRAAAAPRRNGPRQVHQATALPRCRRKALDRAPAVPVLTPAETARFRLWCSLVDPAARLTASAARTRRTRIADSQRVWRAAARRAARP